MTTSAKIRLDKWLWAARFYKTRTLAADAVKGGKVHLDHVRTKPGKEICVGSLVNIRKGEVSLEVRIIALSGRRGPALEAQKLYEETEESVLNREKRKLNRVDQAMVQAYTKGRPTKRNRRRLNQLMGK